MLQNELPPVPGSVHKKKRIGRGNSSGHGTYSGRGVKGQQSRTGYSARIGFEGGQNPLIRALSRQRGFKNRFRVEYEVLSVGQLAKLGAGASITTASLRQAGMVKSAKMPVKILGDGDIDVAITVEAERFSASARAKIEAAGGTVIELNAVADEAEEPARPRRARRVAADSDDNEEPESTEPEAEA